MRSKNAIKNLVFYLFLEIATLALGIVFPRYIIAIYGSSINGLTSTVVRILSLINIIQSGAVGAAIFEMYKPVADGDYETQSAIIYSSKKYYRFFTLFYLLTALILGAVYGWYLQREGLSFLEAFLPFVILAINGAGALLISSICDIYVSPHQKRYYLSISQICNLVVHYGLLALVLYFRLHFLFIYVCILIGGLFNVILNFAFYKKLSANRINSNPLNKSYNISGRRHLTLTCVGNEAITLSPQIIVTTFVSLAASSVFSVYYLIYASMRTILNSIQLSFSAIFGNLVKTSSDSKIFKVYSTIELVTIIVGTVLATCVGFLLIPFVELYTNGIADVNYIYPLLAIFVTVAISLFAFQTSFNYVATVYGLFKNLCVYALVFGGVGIIISAVCTLLFGMPFVMIGILFNQICNSVAILITLKKKIGWFRIKRLLIRFVVMMISTSIGLIMYFCLLPTVEGWGKWIVLGFLSFGSTLLLVIVYCVLFEKEYVLIILKYFLNILKRKKQQKE